MRAGRDPVPPIEVDAEENGLGEEGEALEGERHADDRAGVLHETRPEQPELERQDGARYRADGEQDRGPLGPALRQLEVDAVTAPLPAPLRDYHQHRHRDADDREDD